MMIGKYEVGIGEICLGVFYGETEKEAIDECKSYMASASLDVRNEINNELREERRKHGIGYIAKRVDY